MAREYMDNETDGAYDRIADPKEILKMFHRGERMGITIFYEGKEHAATITDMTMLSGDCIIFKWKTESGLTGEGSMDREKSQ